MSEATQTEHGQCDFEAMSRTTEAHEKLKPFEGTFKAVVKMWMGPGEPMVSTGTIINTLELDGKFLHQHYTGDPSEGPFPNFQGRGYWGYNTAIDKYEGVWIDSASTIMQTEQGDLDGDTWTMLGEMPDQMKGGTVSKKSVITLIDNDHHSMEMYFPGPDGNECKGMEIQYTRA
ncbi:MAG: DUF1579 family protein [Planctomycetota bacterium]|nr:DUF1579 family protein [Planctomycetota bacterium]